MHISKRDGIVAWKAWLVRLLAIVLALLVDAIIIFAVVRLNPIDVYASMFNGAFGTEKKIWFLVRDLMILSCIGIGLAPAFKMRFWNIGAEGQMLVGGIMTAFWMINFAGKLPVPVLFLCMVLSALIAGGVWGFLPGLFKAIWNTNETLFTLMMNYIAIQLTSFFVAKWENPPGSNSVGVINRMGDVKNVGWIGNMFSKGYNADYGWVAAIVLVLAVAMFIYLNYSKQGYEIAVVGDSENTARYAGIRVRNVYMRTMAISGAICGFAGFLAVSAVSHTISTSTAGGRGFTAIIVAWLAKFNTFTMIAISVLIVFLEKGAIEIASKYNLNDYVSSMITGIILFFILGSEFFINYKLIFRSKSKEVA